MRLPLCESSTCTPSRPPMRLWMAFSADVGALGRVRAGCQRGGRDRQTATRGA